MAVKRLFLSVGAMKAGTTFLFHVFNRHPDIYFTPEKELHYFAHANGLSWSLTRPLVPSYSVGALKGHIAPGSILTDDFRRHRLSMVMHNRFSKIRDADTLRQIVHWYADHYLTSPDDDSWFDRVFAGAGDRYAADFSNYHALLAPKGWEHVKRMTTELKVMYVMRDPVARMWSHIKFQLIQSGRREELDHLGPEEVDAMLKTGFMSSHARYGDIVESLKKNLTEKELKIVFLEEFIENVEKSTKDIEDFLGTESFDFKGVDVKRKSNPTEDIPIPDLARERIQRAVQPQIEKLRSLGVRVPDTYVP